MNFRNLFSHLCCCSILAFALLFSVAGLPCAANAQASDAAAPTQPQTSTTQTGASQTGTSQAGTNSPAKEEHRAEKKTEAEETQEYRHSATVQWCARLLHVDVETAAKGFEYINFAVILLAVGIPLFKTLPKALRKRTETLSQELKTAHEATVDANIRLTAVEAKLAGLNTEIGSIRKQVEEDIHEDEVRIKASIGEESARIVAAAEQEIQVAAAQARRGLKQYAVDLAIDRAMSLLTPDSDTDRALIAEFARDSVAGKAEKAGQN